MLFMSSSSARKVLCTRRVDCSGRAGGHGSVSSEWVGGIGWRWMEGGLQRASRLSGGVEGGLQRQARMSWTEQTDPAEQACGCTGPKAGGGVEQATLQLPPPTCKLNQLDMSTVGWASKSTGFFNSISSCGGCARAECVRTCVHVHVCARCLCARLCVCLRSHAAVGALVCSTQEQACEDEQAPRGEVQRPSCRARAPTRHAAACARAPATHL